MLQGKKICFALIIFLLIGSAKSMDEEAEDAVVKQLSEFIIELINQYDETKQGQIQKQKYPFFMRDVFVRGSKLGQEHQDLIDLLEKAATEFTKIKHENKETIGVQDFYDDIISYFTLFLMENQEYSLIIDKLFTDIKAQEEEYQDQSPETTDL